MKSQKATYTDGCPKPRSGTLPPSNKCGSQFKEVWVGPGAVWPCVETGKSLSSTRIRTSDRPVRSLVAISTTLSRPQKLLVRYIYIRKAELTHPGGGIKCVFISYACYLALITLSDVMTKKFEQKLNFCCGFVTKVPASLTVWCRQ